jgi:hypothetical protein
MVYQAPDERTLLFDPTPEQVADIVLNSPHEYWQQGGNGEAAIEVVRSPGEDRPTRSRVVRSDGTVVEAIAGEPSLWIKQPAPHLFFFTWDCGTGWFVPFDGTGCDAFVMDERGGDPFRIPRACLVDAGSAVAIASDFLATRGRSSVVNWAAWCDLPLPPEIYVA